MMEIVERKARHTRITAALLIAAGIIILTNCTDSEGKDSIKNTEEKMKGFKINIEKSTLENKNFRHVVYTSKHNQLVLMSLKPKEEIGEEVHPDTDQFFRFEGGNGKCIVDGTEYEVKDGDALVIPAGARHNVINMNNSLELKMYTIYSPPHHKDGIIHKTKKDAETHETEFDGITTEKNGLKNE